MKLAICKKFNSQPLETRRARFEAAADAEKQIREAQKIGDEKQRARLVQDLQSRLLDKRVAYDPQRYLYLPNLPK